MQITVDVDVDDIIDDMTDKELASYGLIRTKPAGAVAVLPTTRWHDIQHALRQHDSRRVEDLLSSMAWEQAGVILPAGMPLVH